MRRRALYGIADNDTDTIDAIGRAYNAGLLTGGDPKNMLLMARRVAQQYWRVYGFSTPDSLARFQPSDGFGISDPEKDRVREQWLASTMNLVRSEGRDVAHAFEQLVIDLHPDEGPAWLDRIVMAKRNGASAVRDLAVLERALIGLRLIS